MALIVSIRLAGVSLMPRIAFSMSSSSRCRSNVRAVDLTRSRPVGILPTPGMYLAGGGGGVAAISSKFDIIGTAPPP